MTSIPDQDLFKDAARLQGKVVVITGAANGIGKQAAVYFASHGAKVAIGDYNLPGAQRTVADIVQAGGQAIAVKADVSVYETLLELFERAHTEYGTVDVVVANAGVTESGNFIVTLDKDGKPVKPNTKTIDINLVGSIYTAYLAQHYLLLGRTSKENDLKALVLLGSIASWQSIPGGPLYASSKHGVLGLMSSLHPFFAEENVRIAVVCPFFADTAIVPAHVKLFLAGIPKVPVDRIARAIVHAAVDREEASNGAAWMLLDGGNVYVLPREHFKEGVYGVLDKRVTSLFNGVRGVRYAVTVVRDVTSALKTPLIVLGVAASVWLLQAQLL